MDHRQACLAERTIAELRGIALRTRCNIRCCHGRDTVPKTWTTVFRYLKGAYRKGLAPNYGWHLSDCPCPNSDGYDAVLAVAYECGMEPNYDYIKECYSPKALIAAYRYGLIPSRTHLFHFDDKYVPDILCAAYSAGYRPNPEIDFDNREWESTLFAKAWRDAVDYGAKIDYNTVLEIGEGNILKAAYENGGISPDLDHIPFVLEHGILAAAYKAGMPFDYDTQIAFLENEEVPEALDAAYGNGTRPSYRHFFGLTGVHKVEAALAAYGAGLLVQECHGIKEAKSISRDQIYKTDCVLSFFGIDVGQIIIDKIIFRESLV